MQLSLMIVHSTSVEEESNAAEIDGVGEVEMQEDDVGEECYATEVQVEDTM